MDYSLDLRDFGKPGAIIPVREGATGMEMQQIADARNKRIDELQRQMQDGLAKTVHDAMLRSGIVDPEQYLRHFVDQPKGRDKRLLLLGV